MHSLSTTVLLRISLNTGFLDHIFADSKGLSSTTFTYLAPNATEFDRITQNNGHYAVQNHSRSPHLVLFERLYAISYY